MKRIFTSSKLKLLANIQVPKRHHSVCILCKNSLLYDKTPVLATNIHKRELKQIYSGF
jgi:hypothetical protein